MGRCFGFVQYGGYDLSDRLVAKATDVGARRQFAVLPDNLSDRLVIRFSVVQIGLFVGDQLVARILNFCFQRGSSYCGRALVAPTTR